MEKLSDSGVLCIAVGRWTPDVTCLVVSVGASCYSDEQIDSVEEQ